MGFNLVTSIRITIVILALIGLFFMLIPIIMIDEKKYVESKPAPESFTKALKSTFRNRNFVIFEIFFLAYGIALTIFQTGNVYYVNVLSKKFGKKKLCFFAMIMLIIAYVYCSFLGKLPFDPFVQALVFVIFAGVAFAVFGILPNAIAADIAKNDGDKTGEYKEGMFFAVQTFMNKLGQMIAMVVFSSLLLLGKEPGNDMGIRMTGIVAAVIGVVALIIFTRFHDE